MGPQKTQPPRQLFRILRNCLGVCVTHIAQGTRETWMNSSLISGSGNKDSRLAPSFWILGESEHSFAHSTNMWRDRGPHMVLCQGWGQG